MSNKFFPVIETEAEARKLAKQGSIGVLVFTVMNLVGVAFAYYFGISASDRQPVDMQGVWERVVGASILIPLLLFFAWRIYKGKGWLVSGIVLLWSAVEIIAKIAGGTANLMGMVFLISIAGMIYNGLRACWWLCKPPLANPPDSV